MSNGTAYEVLLPIISGMQQPDRFYSDRTTFLLNNWEGKNGVYLVDNGGTGKTISCCCAAICAVRNIELNCDTIVENVSEPSYALRTIRTDSSLVQSVAACIDQVLTRGSNDMQKCKQDWQITKRSWLNLKPGETVPYSDSSIIAYSCGTTLLHSVLFYELFTKCLTINVQATDNVLLLCGGSGAELVGLAMLGSDACPANINIVDINAGWNATVDRLAKTLFPNSKKSVHFHTIDILQQSEVLGALVKDATLITVIYGLTELHDNDRSATERFLNMVFSNMSSNCKMVVADPYKTCFGKDKWIDKIAQSSMNISCTCRVKVRMEEQFVRDSVLAPWISTMGLQLNEDIKLSAHVWYRCYSKLSNVSAGSFQQKNRFALYITSSPDDVKYCEKWLRLKDPTVATFDLGTIQGAEQADVLSSALWHLTSSMLNHGAGVLLLSVRQVHLVPMVSMLHQICLHAQVAIVDNGKKILGYSSSNSNIIESLERILPIKSNRIVVGSFQHFKKGLLLLNDSEQWFRPSWYTLGAPMSFKDLQLQFKHTSKVFLEFKIYCESDCAVENSSYHIHVRGGKWKESPRNTTFKKIENLAGPLSSDISTVVLHVQPGLSPIRLLNLAVSIVAKVAFISSQAPKVTIHFHAQESTPSKKVE